MNNKALCVIVVYNRRLSDLSILVQALAFDSVLDIYIFDNSDLEVYVSCNNKVASSIDDLAYVSFPQNVGTSGAYSYAGKYALQNGYDFLVFLDQDSVISNDYIDDIRSVVIGSVPGDCFVPSVLCDGKLVSPSNIDYFGRFVPHRRGPLTPVVTAIASGLVIKSAVFTQIQSPPPELWLDFYDHWLFRELHRQGFLCISLGSFLEHDLSIQDYSRVSEVRLRSIVAAERIYYSEEPLHIRLVAKVRIFVRMLRLFGLSGIRKYYLL